MSDQGDEEKKTADVEAAEAEQERVVEPDPEPAPRPEPPPTPASSKGERSTTMLTVIGLVLTLIGVAIGSVTTFMTSNATIRAQQEESVDQFRRDNRRDQYSKILQQATNVQNAGNFTSSAVGAFGLQGTALGVPSAIGEAKGEIWQELGVLEEGGLPRPDAIGAPGSETPYQMNALATGIGRVRSSWQDAYSLLDQAISNAEIVASSPVIKYARALRDKYRSDYYAAILKNLEASFANLPDPKPNAAEIAEGLVGAPAETGPPRYEANLLWKSADELTSMFVAAAKEDLEFNDR